MSDELTKKLEEIIVDAEVFPDKVVQELKQAFIDAGWIPLEVEDGDYITVNAKQYRLDGNAITEVTRMTGQEWYDRFENEANSIDPQTPIGDSPRLFALRVARKASGIES